MQINWYPWSALQKIFAQHTHSSVSDLMNEIHECIRSNISGAQTDDNIEFQIQ